VIREAVKGDEVALEGFLAQHSATTMFMRGNLRDFGLNNREAPYAMRYFLTETAGEVTGVGAIANIGTLMAQADESLGEIVAHMVGAAGPDFRPFGILAPPYIVAALRDAFEVGQQPTKMNDIEPHFQLNKAALKMPPMDGFSLRKPTMDDLPVLAAWNHAYSAEVLGGQDEERSRAEAEQTILSGQQRVLVKDGEIVSQTRFNAVLPDAVQVGGVYTPACWRGRGFSRRAVASHLAEAFAGGVENAILFSASESASSVYRAIGFEQIGEYQIILFE